MELPYDGDTNDSSQYCPHGTFIGSWWGPDYLCGWCEDGISVAEMRETLAAQARWRLEDSERRYNDLVASLDAHDFSGSVRAQVIRALPLWART